MEDFEIYRVDVDRADQFEPLGSKPKFWFRENERRLLFKADDRGTGEDWAEVIACHLCKLLGLPHVHYELAARYKSGVYEYPGVICENMAPPPRSLTLGNELLLSQDSKYPLQQRFNVRQHTVGAVVGVLEKISSTKTDWPANYPEGVASAVDIFIGYLMLDAWIANQDRHHENWGALVDSPVALAPTLAPTFDHGAALGRNLTDVERQERLSTNDRGRAIPAFAKRARSAIYQTEDDKQPLGTHQAFQAFAKFSPSAATGWLGQLAAVSREQICGIIENIPEVRMSPVSKTFTIELLLENKRRLLNERNL